MKFLLRRRRFNSAPQTHGPDRSERRGHPLRCETLEDRLNLDASFNQLFVSQVYTDILHRNVDPNGLSHWIQAIDQGASLYQVVLGIETSTESNDDQVEQMYETYLNRPVDPNGLADWATALQNTSVEQVQAGILGSAEFFRDAGGTDQGFLNLLYKDTLNRAVDPSGEAGWMGALESGASTASIASHVLTSPEYDTDLVQSYYKDFLHHGADPSSLQSWVSGLENGTPNQDVIASILSSGEFQADVQSGVLNVPAPVITSPTAVRAPGSPSDSQGHLVVTSSTYDITGTAPAGSLVRIYDDSGKLVGSQQLTSSSDSFSITVSLKANALNHFAVTDTNAAGAESMATTVPAIRQAASLAIVTSPGEQKNYEGDTVSLPLSVTTYTTTTPGWTATGLPKGLSINPSTGVITGTLAAGDAGTSPYTVTVTFGGFTSGSATFTWLVSVKNNIAVTPPATQTSVDGAAVSGVTVHVTEPDTDSNPLTYSATNLPKGLTINPSTGVISGTIGADDSAHSPYTVTVSVTDGLDSASATFTWNVTPAAPAITTPSSVPAAGAPGAVTTSTYDITGTAAAGSLVRIYNSSDTVVGSQQLASSSGSFSITVPLTANSVNNFTATATNAAGAVSAAATVPAIRQAASLATVTSPGEQKSYEGATISLPLTVTSYVTTTPIWTATGLPKGLSINPTSGTITGTLAEGDAAKSTYSVTVTFDGYTSGSATFTWLVSVKNNITLTPPATQTSVEGATISGVTVHVAEADTDTNPLTYTASNLPPGLTIDPNTGVISGKIQSGASAHTPYTVTVSVTDGLDSASATFTWNVTVAG